MMPNKYLLNRIINLAKLFVLHKLSFEHSSLSNLINTFDDLFRHTYKSPIYHMKQKLKSCSHNLNVYIL